MVLVDTSVWVDHLRRADPVLMQLLEADEVLTHPFVIGELACGLLADRQTFLYNLSRLARVRSADDGEVLEFIERRQLMGRGVGYLDMHLLASACLTPGVRLWTRDRKLAALVAELDKSH